MSASARSVSDTAQRLSSCDPTLKYINLYDKQLTDSQLAELVDCLLAHPNVVRHVWLAGNRLTDEMGIKLARYVAASSTIEYLDLRYNLLSEATYLAMAAALRVNSSLRVLYLNGNQAVDPTRIDAAFVEALRLNPVRQADSVWQLYKGDWVDLDFKRLQDTAHELGHPSLQLLLTNATQL